MIRIPVLLIFLAGFFSSGSRAEDPIPLKPVPNAQRIVELESGINELEDLRANLWNKFNEARANQGDWHLGLSFKDALDVLMISTSITADAIPEERQGKAGAAILKLAEVSANMSKVVIGNPATDPSVYEDLVGSIDSYTALASHLAGLDESGKAAISITNKSVLAVTQLVNASRAWRKEKNQDELRKNLASVGSTMTSIVGDAMTLAGQAQKVPWIKGSQAVVNFVGMGVLSWYLIDSARSARLACDMSEKAETLLRRKIFRISLRLERDKHELSQLVDFRAQYLKTRTELREVTAMYDQTRIDLMHIESKYKQAMESLNLYARLLEDAKGQAAAYQQKYREAELEVKEWKRRHDELSQQYNRRAQELQVQIDRSEPSGPWKTDDAPSRSGQSEIRESPSFEYLKSRGINWRRY